MPNSNWRDGTPNLRTTLAALAVYALVLFAAGSVLLLFSPDQRLSYWWIGPALALAVLGFLWGRGGDQWSMVLIIAASQVGNAYKSVKPWPMSLLAAAGMFATIWVGYGAGRLSLLLGRSAARQRNEGR